MFKSRFKVCFERQNDGWCHSPPVPVTYAFTLNTSARQRLETHSVLSQVAKLVPQTSKSIFEDRSWIFEDRPLLNFRFFKKVALKWKRRRISGHASGLRLDTTPRPCDCAGALCGRLVSTWLHSSRYFPYLTSPDPSLTRLHFTK